VRNAFWSLTFLLLGSTVLAGERRDTAVRISFNDGHGLVRSSDAVREEVDEILREAGIETEWVGQTRYPASRAPRLEVTVIVSPSDPAGEGYALKAAAMGVYLQAEESSAVFVFYRRVLDVLGLSGRVDGNGGLLTPAERRAVARALGRVIVHELVHRVAPSVAHSRRGVMQARLTRRFLTCPHLSLDEASRDGLLAAIAEGSVARSGLPSDGRE
jgi:hypothetical protein